MPTNDELTGLIASGWEWGTINGIDGIRFGYGKNTIFLPAGVSKKLFVCKFYFIRKVFYLLLFQKIIIPLQLKICNTFLLYVLQNKKNYCNAII